MITHPYYRYPPGKPWYMHFTGLHMLHQQRVFGRVYSFRILVVTKLGTQTVSRFSTMSQGIGRVLKRLASRPLGCICGQANPPPNRFPYMDLMLGGSRTIAAMQTQVASTLGLAPLG